MIAILILSGAAWKIFGEKKGTQSNVSDTSIEASDNTGRKTEDIDNNNPSNSEASKTTTSCSGLSQVEYLDCIFKSAIKNSNYSLCQSLANPTEDICLEQVGINTNNESVCQKISQTELRDSCYRFVAIKKSQTDICRKISLRDETDKCYLGIAKNLQDTSLCFNVQTREFHNECLKIDPEHKKNLETGQ